jgi:uncharacterized protein (TIGR02145 family)
MNHVIKISGIILLIILNQSCQKEEENVIKDVDGNVYTTVTIGKQVWVVENLKVTRYSNGDLIGTTTPATLDITGESTPKYQWAYDGNESNVATYGRLYTWYAATDSRNICPTGWHVPSLKEWLTLRDTLGGDAVAGGKLKEKGTNHWLSPNTGATNETGFTALPGGLKVLGQFDGIGLSGNLWSSSLEPNYSNPYFMMISNSYSWFFNLDDLHKLSLAVRCLKD